MDTKKIGHTDFDTSPATEHKVDSEATRINQEFMYILELANEDTLTKKTSEGSLYSLEINKNMYQLEIQKEIWDILDTGEFSSLFWLDKNKADHIFINDEKHELCIIYKS